MKNMKINLFALALVIGGTFVTSCSEDDATGNSVLEVNSGVTGSVVTDFDSSAALTVNEVDEETFTYMVSISEAQPVDIHLTVSQISGSATPDEDFTFDSVVVIPAYATTASGSISILNDLTPESLESFTLQIGGVNTSNATIPVKTVTFNIVNELSNELKLDFHFNRTFRYYITYQHCVTSFLFVITRFIVYCKFLEVMVPDFSGTVQKSVGLFNKMCQKGSNSKE